MKNQVYESFHKRTVSQKSIITPNNFTYHILLKSLNKSLSNTTKNILDIGCGAGTIAIYLASKGYNVVGIDISEKAINACKKTASTLKLNNVKFTVCKFPEETPNNKYDFIILSEVIEHLKDDDWALKRINRMLTKNGILFLTTPSKNAPLHKLGLTYQFDKRVGHLRRYTLEELNTKLNRNNFIVINSFKEEGILRNFLFTNFLAGKLIRFIKFFLVNIVSFIDNVLVKVFGESQLIVIAQKKN